MASVVQTFPSPDSMIAEPRSSAPTAVAEETTGSAASWGAIFAGAAAAAALSLILLLLGTGLGFSMVSPWAAIGTGARAVGISTIVWITFTQLMSAGLGGYLAGRLRTKWPGVHTHEVFFRDTAHGFLAWTVASLVMVIVVNSVISSTFKGGAAATGAVISDASTGAAGLMSGKGGSTDATISYYTDSLFRRSGDAASAPGAGSSTTSADGDKARVGAEAARILVNDLAANTLPAQDATYLGQLVAQTTGLSPHDATQRVNDTFANIKATLANGEQALAKAAEAARKATAYASLWLFVSLLSAAFVASLCATAGGRRRDLY